MRPLTQGQDATRLTAGCFRRRGWTEASFGFPGTRSSSVAAGPLDSVREIALRPRVALLCGDGRVEPYQPHGVCLIEFGDAFS
jgi:hypothetical protein